VQKYKTPPTLFNEVLQLSTTTLKKIGYLAPGAIADGKLTWERDGMPLGSISIQVNTHSEQPYIKLDYQYRNEPRNYKVRLVSIPSNLGKGKIWYFLCPQTKKRCRKLYSVGGYFLHREAFTGCMYESQAVSKDNRSWDQIFEREAMAERLHKKHFRKFYAGKPTRNYLRIMKAQSKQ
jgi:hypothetical protein